MAENALKLAGSEGHWVILQNIHLVERWLPTLEKRLEQNYEKSHKKYRVFLSAEPAPSAETHILPQVNGKSKCFKNLVCYEVYF